MVKPLVAMISLLGGVVAVGLALYIQVEPTALTTPGQQTAAGVRAERVVPPAPVHTVNAARPTEHGVISIDPIEIRVPVPRVQKPVPAAEPAPPLATEPCSDWRDLGPKATESAPSTTHRVRQLCVS